MTVRIKDVGTVVLRRNTSDARVFSQVFVEQQYNLTWYPQFADVKARYDEILRSDRRPLIIDAGANNGASALWFHGQFPEARRIFESLVLAEECAEFLTIPAYDRID